MKRKQLFLTLCIPVLALIIIACVVFWPRTPVIAFYQVPKNVEKVICDLAQNPAYAGKAKFRIWELDPEKSLESQIGKTQKNFTLLFTYDGKAASSLAEKVTPPPADARNLMPTTMRQAGATNNTIYGLPILLDHFEIAYNWKMFQDAGQKNPETLDSLKASAKAIKKPSVWPIVCAGGQDTDLLMLVGSLTETLGSTKDWEALTEALSEGKTFREILKETPLKKTLQELLQWRKEGLIHPEWYTMTDKDVLAFIENNYTGIIFMPLSTHRTIPASLLVKYNSIPMPPAGIHTERSFTLPVLLGIVSAAGKKDIQAQSFLAHLVDAEAQARECMRTGLAPVNSTADAPDKQSNDVRFFAATATRILPDPGKAAFDSPQKKAEFARDIRSYLQADGVGF
jgi:ABC-type glycerol-3-phosphate transport system substrate-binding protein